MKHHNELHRVGRTGWLRAAVLGANDGLISTASLIIGVAAAHPEGSAVLLAGVAGLVGGSLSMAAGEYVSVSSQADSEQADLARERGLYPGVMIEIPAAALLADRILEHVEFLSIGTNDLAQYTMAADRMSSDLATLTDPWQPGVVALVAATARAGAAVGKPVGVCGEAAADPLMACVLTGLGITSLSAAASAVPPVGAKLASVTLQQCRDAADAVLATASPAEAREAAMAVLG
jgi:phosphotransferase system enzyme I (PtsI)